MKNLVRRARALMVLATIAAAMLGGTPGAQAALTSPASGATVEGVVTISDPVGGTNGCGVGYPSYARTEFQILNSMGQYVYTYPDFRSPSGGARTEMWNSAERLTNGNRRFPNGSYYIRTMSASSFLAWYNTGWGGYYYCTTSGYFVTSNVSITVRNWDNEFVDINGGGRIGINLAPVEEFVFEPTGAPRFIRDASTIEVYSLPGTVRPDLTCAGDPATCVPPQPPAGSELCGSQTQGCEARLVKISVDDAELTLNGMFDLRSGAFLAVVEQKATGTRSVLSRGVNCATGPDGTKRCATDRPTVCAIDPTSGRNVCFSTSGVPALPPTVPPVPPAPPVPAVPVVCVFHPVSGEQVCTPA